MRSKLLLLLLSCISLLGNSQIVTVPAFPAQDKPLEVVFNAKEGNAGLAGFTGDVYAHTGVLTNLSTSQSNWKYVKTNWGVNTPETKLERIGTDLYKFTTGTKTIREFYGVPASETITHVAFVFRSATQVGSSYREGKAVGNADIFAQVYAEGLFVNFSAPFEQGKLVSAGESLSITATANKADSVLLYIDNIKVAGASGITISHTTTAAASGKHIMIARAKFGNEWAADTTYYFIKQAVTIAPIPDGIRDGINYIDNNTVILSLFAPGKNNVFVIGDFNNWEFSEEGFMNKTPDGTRFWKQISGLTPGKEYIFQYLVDETIRIGDPYADKVSDPWNDQHITNLTYPNLIKYPASETTEIATVLQTGQTPYNWTIDNFTPPAKTDLVIYELLLRDFLAAHDYKTLIDTLSYLKKLGVNAIELMPNYEFEGNLSWGYNTAFHFAPDKYYGPKNDLKRFIDVCHQEGIAVIFDIVLNHVFGSSPLARLYWDSQAKAPAADNPWLNQVAKHDYNVGFDFNHESAATKYLVNRVVEYWITEYNVDGYRFDLSKGFTQKNTLGNTGAWGQYDASRIAIWKNIANYIWSVDPDTYVILEHFAENTEEKELANYGMMIWGNLNHNYRQAAMGYSNESDLTWGSYKARGWNSPNLITYMESHDEERMMYSVTNYGNISNSQYNTRHPDTAIDRMALAATFFYTIPGPKMIWQFGELAYDFSIDYNGRVGDKPIRWDYREDYRREYLYNTTAALVNLKKQHDVFRTTDFTTSLNGLLKKVNLRGTDMSVTVLGNFNVMPGKIVPDFSVTGKWYEFFTGDSITVSSLTAEITLEPGEYRLYTTKKLANPETGLGIDDNIESSNTIIGNIFPSPTTGTIFIPVNIERPGPIEIIIYNTAGQVVDRYKNNFMPSGQQRIERNIRSGSGLHVVKLVSGSKIETTKFVKK